MHAKYDEVLKEAKHCPATLTKGLNYAYMSNLEKHFTIEAVPLNTRFRPLVLRRVRVACDHEEGDR